MENPQPIEVSKPSFSSKKLLLVAGLFLLVFATGAAGYFFGKQSQAPKQPIQTGCTEEAKICPDGTYVSRIPPACDFAPCPKSEKPIITANPAINYNNPATITPITSPKKSLNYQLPSGWKTVQDETKTFEVGYNPTDTTSALRSTKDMIALNTISGSNILSVGLFDYDGGSRHNFIFQHMNQSQTKGDNPSAYREVEYTYNGRSCLFLENLEISMMPFVWGMCDVGNNQAFLITSYSLDYRQILQTIRKIE